MFMGLFVGVVLVGFFMVVILIAVFRDEMMFLIFGLVINALVGGICVSLWCSRFLGYLMFFVLVGVVVVFFCMAVRAMPSPDFSRFYVKFVMFFIMVGVRLLWILYLVRGRVGFFVVEDSCVGYLSHGVHFAVRGGKDFWSFGFWDRGRVGGICWGPTVIGLGVIMFLVVVRVANVRGAGGGPVVRFVDFFEGRVGRWWGRDK